MAHGRKSKRSCAIQASRARRGVHITPLRRPTSSHRAGTPTTLARPAPTASVAPWSSRTSAPPWTRAMYCTRGSNCPRFASKRRPSGKATEDETDDCSPFGAHSGVSSRRTGEHAVTAATATTAQPSREITPVASANRLLSPGRRGPRPNRGGGRRRAVVARRRFRRSRVRDADHPEVRIALAPVPAGAWRSPRASLRRRPT